MYMGRTNLRAWGHQWPSKHVLRQGISSDLAVIVLKFCLTMRQGSFRGLAGL